MTTTRHTTDAGAVAVTDWTLDPSRYEGHTPGPWGEDCWRGGVRMLAEPPFGADISTPRGDMRYEAQPQIGVSETAANARLIADAPALLALAVKQAEELAALRAVREAAERVADADAPHLLAHAVAMAVRVAELEVELAALRVVRFDDSSEEEGEDACSPTHSGYGESSDSLPKQPDGPDGRRGQA